jgi:fibronectin-binding autotransporter adhesin
MPAERRPPRSESNRRDITGEKMQASQKVHRLSDKQSKIFRRSRRYRNALAALAAVSMVGADRALEANTTSYYTGASAGGTGASPATSDWNNAANWGPVGVPVSGSTTETDYNGSSGAMAAYTSFDDFSTFNLTALRFVNASATYTDTLAPSSPGNTINMVLNGSTLPSVSMASTGAFNVSTPLAFASGLNFGGGNHGTLTLLGALTGAGTFEVTNTTGENVVIEAPFTMNGNINISGSCYLTIGTGGTLPAVPVTGVSASLGNLTLNNSDINSSSAAINSSLRLIKAGTGSFFLSGNSNYSGGTNVSGGNLYALTATSIGTGTLNVSNGATFSYMPSTAGTLNLSSGSIILANGSTIGTAIGGTLGQSAINANSSTAANTSGTVKLNIYGVSGATATTGTNNLITAVGGLNGATYTLGNIYDATNFTVTPGSLAASTTAVSVGVTSTSALTTEYWKGGFSGATNVWSISNGTSASNWTVDAGGTTATSLVPGTAATVVFSATGATNQGNMTLGSSMSVGGIVVNDTTPIVLNSDGNTLTLGSGGVTINSTSGNPTVTLNAPLTLGAGQTWNTSSTNPLTIGGNLAMGANLTLAGSGPINLSGTLSGTGGLTLTGSNAVILNGTATYTGATTVNSGTLTYSGSGSITSSSNLTVAAVVGSAQAFYNSAANSSFGTFNVGTIAGASGAFTQTAGIINANVGGAYVEVGQNSINAYGSYTLAGGTLNVSPTSAGGMIVGDSALGSFVQTNGVMNLTRYFVLGKTTGTGVATFTGGVTNIFSTGIYIIAGNNGGTGDLNLGTETGGNAVINSGSTTGVETATGGGSGVINLNSGTFNVSAGFVSGTSGVGQLNLNGGLIRATATSSTLISNNFNAVTVYNGGITIDTQTNTATISANLLGATGKGIYATSGGTGMIAVPGGSGGSGYIGAPVITSVIDLTNGSATGATAIANISNGVITGVTITNPGQGYSAGDSLQFNFSGGGASSAVSNFTTTLAPGDLANNGTGGLTKLGTGTLTLSGADTYQGPTAINSGTLVLNNASAITTTSTGTISFGGGTLQYSANNTNDYSSSFSTTANQAYSINTGGQSVTFATGLTSSGGSFNKSGAGTLTLSGVSTYTGPTLVTGGTLAISSTGGLGNTAVSVSNGATLAPLAGSGLITIGSGSASVGVLAGGTLSLSDGSIGHLNISSGSATGLTLGSATGAAASIVLDMSQAVVDSINVTGGVSVLGSGASFQIVPTPGATSWNIGSYTLITASGGLGVSGFNISNPTAVVNGNIYDLSLSHSTATAEILTVAQDTAPTNLYWTGAINTYWNANNSGGTNWNTDATSGIDGGVPPAATTNVIFTVAGGGQNLNTSLGANTTVNSVTFNGDASGAVSIAAGNTLTIQALNYNGNTVGNGINMMSGSSAVTVNANVVPGNAQTWTNNSTNPLTFNGNVSGSAPVTIAGSGAVLLQGTVSGSMALTLADTGAVTLSGNNSFTGGVNASAGMLNLNSPTALGSGGLIISGPVTLDNTTGSVLTLTTNNAQTWNTSSFTFNGSSNLNMGSGAVALAASGTLNLNAGTLTVGGTVSDGGAGYTLTTAGAGNLNLAGNLAGKTVFVFTGPGTVNLSGTNSFLGTTNVAGGVVNISGSQTGTNNLIVSGGIANVTGTQSALCYLYVGGTAGALLNINTSGTFNLLVGSTVGGSSNLSGAVDQTSGTVYVNSVSGTGNFVIGGASGGALSNAYGSYTISGGSFINNSALNPTGLIVGGAGGIGILTQTGGYMNAVQALTIGTGYGSYGVVTETGGQSGYLNDTNSGAAVVIGSGSAAGGQLNIGTEVAGNGTFYIGGTGAGATISSTSGFESSININGSPVELANGVGFKYLSASGRVTLNLNGATINTDLSTQNIIDSSFNGINGGAFVYRGGVTIETASGTSSTVSANLQGAAGSGLYKNAAFGAVPQGTPLTGYFGAPVVLVSSSGSGSGAEAIANVDTNPADSTYEQVTGFTLVDPGQNYVAGDQLTFTLYGGTSNGLNSIPTYTYTVTSADLQSNAGALNKTGSGTLTLSGSNNYAGGTNITAGKLIFSNAGAFPAGTNLTITGTSSVAQVAAQPTGVSASLLQIATLANSGTLDLTNNAAVITGDSYSAIFAEIATGFNGGKWNGSSGSGAIISSLAASNSTHLTAIGVATGQTSFEGQTVASSSVLVKYTYYGDANLDGKVDGSDYSLIDNGYLSGLTGWDNGDFNYDGVVNGSDYTLIDNAFNSQGSTISAELASPTAQIAGSPAAVPEPTSVGLIACAAVGLLGRRRRR